MFGSGRASSALRRSVLPSIVTVLAFAVLWTGCDTIIDPGSEPVVIETAQTFRFETSRAALSQGVTLSSDVPLNVSSALAGYGFTTGDILSAQIVEVTFERVQPVGASLNSILSSATVRATAASLPEVVIGSSSTMSAAASQQLTPGSVTNLAAYLRAGNVPLRLSVQPGQSLAHENYVFRARVTLRLTLEGA